MANTTADTLAEKADAAYTEAQAKIDVALARSDLELAAAKQAVANVTPYIIGGALNPVDVAPNIITAPVLPSTDYSTDVQNAFNYAFGSFNSILQSQITNFLTAFFPDISATLKSGSDQWLIDTIANGRYVPASVETALWNRAKDKEVQEAARMEQEVIDASASRGFSAPSGTLAYTISANQQELAKKLTTINRDISIKAFDTANENTKFAIQQAVNLRTAFVAAMGDFIKVAMVQPNNAVEYAKVILQAKTGLYESAVRLYSSQIDEAKMRSSVDLENRSQDLRYYEIGSRGTTDYQSANIASAKVKADVAMTSADQLARIAAAAMATRNSVVSVSAAV